MDFIDSMATGSATDLLESQAYHWLTLELDLRWGAPPPDPPGIIGLRLPWFIDLYRKSYMNERGWRPTISGGLGGGAPSLFRVSKICLESMFGWLDARMYWMSPILNRSQRFCMKLLDSRVWNIDVCWILWNFNLSHLFVIGFEPNSWRYESPPSISNRFLWL